MNRRHFIISGVIGAGAMVASRKVMAMDIFGSNKKKEFPFQLTDKQWRERLTPDQYKILRSAGTEQSCSSPLNLNDGAGDYYCVGCGHHLFASDNKFKSESGWPSFYQPVDEYAIGTTTDYKIGYARTEAHCANCGGHLGHIFKDGPPPTGLRYCMNGTVLDFKAR